MIRSIPDVTFQTRVRDDSLGGDNPFKWEAKTSSDYFANKRVILFSLPGAFTPTCSTFQLPDFNKLYDDFKEFGIDEIYCISVNDSFVMNAWAKHHDIGKVKVIPDGSGEFTRKMGMLVKKDNLGFGLRSWRYAVIIENNEIMQSFIEAGFKDDAEDDPYVVSSPQNILKYLKEESKVAV
ncbi:MAG: peroxiredoxin [Alphaproteobacteria bacterium]|tara:strand:- start:893 stop:1432 length:540 start_codon:yes stop_codon:yes gene_type:complete